MTFNLTSRLVGVSMAFCSFSWGCFRIPLSIGYFLCSGGSKDSQLGQSAKGTRTINATRFLGNGKLEIDQTGSEKVCAFVLTFKRRESPKACFRTHASQFLSTPGSCLPACRVTSCLCKSFGNKGKTEVFQTSPKQRKIFPGRRSPGNSSST